ncbi:guanylate cyclase soluble subunit beta-2 [Narcine bancroftii]|uniref:guanylate cyclase soluble subunit beta-2 n=1 Tax=Narcine bancroftii TaxID=1343680 RepID=UPI0038311B72
MVSVSRFSAPEVTGPNFHYSANELFFLSPTPASCLAHSPFVTVIILGAGDPGGKGAGKCSPGLNVESWFRVGVQIFFNPCKGGTQSEESALYGFINTCLKSLVVENFGEEKWEALRSRAEVEDTFMTYQVYDDAITLSLVQAASDMFNISTEALLKLFGRHFFTFCKMSGYDQMLHTLGGSLMEFIENLDALHSYLALSYQQMKAPSFRVERREDGEVKLHYYSDRKGLCHIVPGIIEAVAKDFFETDVEMEILNQLGEEEHTEEKEHVVFLIVQKKRDQVRKVKDIEKHLTKTKVQDHALPHCSGRKSHWGILRSVVKFGYGNLLYSFEPAYPERLWIDKKAFCHAFPFHVVFDEELKVKQAGVNIQKYVPGLQMKDIKVNKYFAITHPAVPFTISSIRKFINSQFVLKTRREMMPMSWKSQPMLKLRGQMLWMGSIQCMIYLCSPQLRSLQELEERKMHLADIAQHDTTRDLIFLNQQRLAEIELSNQLEHKKEELRILSKNLEVEKKKTEVLLYAMLPKHVANLLKEGKRVEAGEFKECTILFSDVVTFTNICAICEPIQIVHMLNAMYSQFDRITSVHNVYKVETIGDAYMVVGGVPIPVSSHAERVANFALGMRIAARKVKNPVTGDPIQIRVGIHSGPVLAGVVGEKMPRYCLFGDTVNTASRMESHGLPGKIHLSAMANRALQKKGFEIVERGAITVKGKGKMTTYFLVQNLCVTEEEIMGQPSKASGSDSNQTAKSCKKKSDQNESLMMNIELEPLSEPENEYRKNPPEQNSGDEDGKTIAAMKYADNEKVPTGDCTL